MLPQSLILTALLSLALAGCSPEPVDHALPAHIPSLQDGPYQRALLTRQSFDHETWRITPVADYTITARIIGKERYFRDDLAELVPYDLALAWGPAASNDVQAQLSVWQSGRWFFWKTLSAKLPLPRRDLINNMANTHIVILDEDVRAFVAGLSEGDIVTLHGQLVNLEEKGNPISGRRTSILRNDTGAGSCEILLLRAARLERAD